MADDPLVRVRVADVGGRAHLAWAEGEHVNLPQSVLTALGVTRAADDSALRLPKEPVRVTSADAERLRLRRAFTDVAPLTARLPVSYQHAPSRARVLVASIIGRWNRRRVDRWARFPAWPLDLSADFVADCASGDRSRRASGPAPVMLSHDLDSPEGLSNLVDRFLPLEEQAGARSTSFVVPCAWPLDHGLLAEVRDRGHRIGVHGYDHANLTPFAQPAERRRRLDAARPVVERYTAIGYRAPSLLRTRPLLQDLASRYRYDSSMPTSGGLFPVPNSGCATARLFEVEGITEIPITLPRDGSLRFLGYTPREIADLWIACARRIARSRGVVMLLTHCERRFSGGPAMLDTYRTFLEAVASEPQVFAWTTAEDLIAAAAVA